MDLSPLTEWLRDSDNAPLLVVTATLLLAWTTWYPIHAYRRHQMSGREYHRAQRELAYQSFVDALKGVIGAVEDEVLASAPSRHGVMGAAAGEDSQVQDRWWQETVRLGSDKYRQALARLSTASEAVEADGSPRARRLAVGLLTAAQKAGEEHPRRTHYEMLQRLLSWLEQGRDRFEKVFREDVGYGD